mmetsp:Transcript_21483/g.34651  ORF Transcript_21483/g.34651 Transcript_21483/m.34651 type:complete len:1390 (-) Transcript_21483:228-4397(-)
MSSDEEDERLRAVEYGGPEDKGKIYKRFEKRLGTGAYKDVYLAYNTDDGTDVAWNTVKLARVPQTERERIQHETNVLGSIKHKNIIKFFDVWKNDVKKEVCFTTEIVQGGTLKSFIRRVYPVSIRVLKKWCIQILEALDYLHGNTPPIIHRDLKCDNIFVNSKESALLIGDFGLAALRKQTCAKSVLGTPHFMAPELYDESYTEKVDIYAFGMCVLEMATNETPYIECINPAQIFKKVYCGQPPDVLKRIKTTSVREFIEICLLPAEKRLSAKELLRHPFLDLLPQDRVEVEVEPPKEKKSQKTATSKSRRRSPKRKKPKSKRNKTGKNGARPSVRFSEFPKEKKEKGASQDLPTPSTDISQDQQSVQHCMILLEAVAKMKSKTETQASLTLKVKIAKDKDKGATGPVETKEIDFDFNLQTDTVEQVCEEMVREFDLKDPALARLIEEIQRVLSTTLLDDQGRAQNNNTIILPAPEVKTLPQECKKPNDRNEKVSRKPRTLPPSQHSKSNSEASIPISRAQSLPTKTERGNSTNITEPIIEEDVEDIVVLGGEGGAKPGKISVDVDTNLEANGTGETPKTPSDIDVPGMRGDEDSSEGERNPGGPSIIANPSQEREGKLSPLPGGAENEEDAIADIDNEEDFQKLLEKRELKMKKMIIEDKTKLEKLWMKKRGRRNKYSAFTQPASPGKVGRQIRHSLQDIRSHGDLSRNHFFPNDMPANFSKENSGGASKTTNNPQRASSPPGILPEFLEDIIKNNNVPRPSVVVDKEQSPKTLRQSSSSDNPLVVSTDGDQTEERGSNISWANDINSNHVSPAKSVHQFSSPNHPGPQGTFDFLFDDDEKGEARAVGGEHQDGGGSSNGVDGDDAIDKQKKPSPQHGAVDDAAASTNIEDFLMLNKIAPGIREDGGDTMTDKAATGTIRMPSTDTTAAHISAPTLQHRESTIELPFMNQNSSSNSSSNDSANRKNDNGGVAAAAKSHVPTINLPQFPKTAASSSSGLLENIMDAELSELRKEKTHAPISLRRANSGGSIRKGSSSSSKFTRPLPKNSGGFPPDLTMVHSVPASINGTTRGKTLPLSASDVNLKYHGRAAVAVTTANNIRPISQDVLTKAAGILELDDVHIIEILRDPNRINKQRLKLQHKTVDLAKKVRIGKAAEVLQLESDRRRGILHVAHKPTKSNKRDNAGARGGSRKSAPGVLIGSSRRARTPPPEPSYNKHSSSGSSSNSRQVFPVEWQNSYPKTGSSDANHLGSSENQFDAFGMLLNGDGSTQLQSGGGFTRSRSSSMRVEGKSIDNKSGLAERRGSASRLDKRGAGSSSTPSLEEEKVTRETLEAKRKKEGDQAEATLLSWLEEPQASKMPKVATIRATSVSADSLRQFADQFPKNNLKE